MRSLPDDAKRSHAPTDRLAAGHPSLRRDAPPSRGKKLSARRGVTASRCGLRLPRGAGQAASSPSRSSWHRASSSDGDAEGFPGHARRVGPSESRLGQRCGHPARAVTRLDVAGSDSRSATRDLGSTDCRVARLPRPPRAGPFNGWARQLVVDVETRCTSPYIYVAAEGEMIDMVSLPTVHFHRTVGARDQISAGGRGAVQCRDTIRRNSASIISRSAAT